MHAISPESPADVTLATGTDDIIATLDNLGVGDEVLLSIKCKSDGPITGLVCEVSEGDEFDFVEYLEGADFTSTSNGAQRIWSSGDPGPAPHEVNDGETAYAVIKNPMTGHMRFKASGTVGAVLRVAVKVKSRSNL